MEDTLKMDERLKLLEAALASRGVIFKAATPWWRDAKTITILGALLAAVIPVVTAIDGILKNRGEAQKALIEQQDKIRQTYLDRVLKPGITEDEQQRIFSLLAKLQTDPEFQEWAMEEHNKATAKINDLIKEKSELEAQNKNLLAQVEAERLKAPKLITQHKPSEDAKVKRLESELEQANNRVNEIQRRIGEGATNLARCSDGRAVTCQAYRCVCTENVGCTGYDAMGNVVEGKSCFSTNLKTILDNVSKNIK